MKTLGLCFPLLLSVLVVDAPAQQEGNAPALNTDKAAIQKWLVRGGQAKWPRVDSDRVILTPEDSDRSILSLDDRESSCVYMRTYRVKREARDFRYHASRRIHDLCAGSPFRGKAGGGVEGGAFRVSSRSKRFDAGS